jgi:AcrR family transcriptional regulator
MIRSLDPHKRASFLEAALQLFVARGVQNTSTAAIAQQAGAAAGTLFLYFPTKQELIDALALHIARQQSEHIYALLQPDLSARQTFAAIWRGSLEWFLQHPDAYRYIQQVRDSGMLSRRVVEESNQSFAYYYAAIQKGLAEGCLKPYPLELIGGMLYQAIVGVMNLLNAQADPAEQDGLIRMGFDIFWDGIRLHPSGEAQP